MSDSFVGGPFFAQKWQIFVTVRKKEEEVYIVKNPFFVFERFISLQKRIKGLKFLSKG